MAIEVIFHVEGEFPNRFVTATDFGSIPPLELARKDISTIDVKSMDEFVYEVIFDFTLSRENIKFTSEFELFVEQYDFMCTEPTFVDPTKDWDYNSLFWEKCSKMDAII